MTWYKVTYRSGRVEYINDDDPVNRNMIDVYRRNARTASPIRNAMGQGGSPNSPAKVEKSSEAAARRAAKGR